LLVILAAVPSTVRTITAAGTARDDKAAYIDDKHSGVPLEEGLS